MKTLLAGPFVGEFGHELFCWQGFIRQCAKECDKTIVLCRKGHEVLYEDFAEEIIEYPCDCFITDGHRCQGETPQKHRDFIKKVGLANEEYRPGLFKLGYKPTKPEKSKPLFFYQDFFKYGMKLENPKYKYDFLLHIRKTQKNKSNYRNTSVEEFKELLTPFEGKIGCIGLSSGADYLEGTDDLRDIPLKELVKYMSASKLIIGPSSGPMHLATLCGLPQVVWGGWKHSEIRYETYWNPFKIPCAFILCGEYKNWTIEGKKEEIQTAIKKIREL